MRSPSFHAPETKILTRNPQKFAISIDKLSFDAGYAILDSLALELPMGQL